jgi:hypothetical protein
LQWLPSISSILNPTNLKAGVYSVQATDANGCTYSTTVTVTQPGNPINLLLSSTNATSFTSNDGTAKVIAQGGVSPYGYAWNPGGGISDTIQGRGPNTYVVTVTDANGCSTAGSVIITSPEGLEDWNKMYQLNISPNPANDYLTITSAVAMNTLSISNVNGQILQTQKLNSTTANISIKDIAPGIYLLHINGVVSRKIIVQK